VKGKIKMSNRRILGAVILAAVFGCSSDDSSVDDTRELPEGGGIRVEFMGVGSSLAQAFFGFEPDGDRVLFDDMEVTFVTSQDPSRREFPYPTFDLGRELPDGTICFPAQGLTPVEQNQQRLDTRTYLDVGDHVMVSGPDGFELQLTGIDGGVSPLQGVVHGRIYLPSEDDLTPDQPLAEGWYLPHPEAMPEGLPEFAPTNGVGEYTGEPVGQFGAYKPPPLSIVYPVETDYLQNGMALNSDEDYVVTVHMEDLPPGVEVLKGTALVSSMNVAFAICGNANMSNDTVTIPKELIAQAGPFGAATVNWQSMLVYEWDGRQYYTLGMSCLLSAFCVDDPAAVDGVCSPAQAARMKESGWRPGLRVPAAPPVVAR
jgi:hypothetical protein